MKFSPDLVVRVRAALDRSGYCFFGVDEIERLLPDKGQHRTARRAALEEFARLCGAEVETTPHLKSARFTPAQTCQPEAAFSLEALFQTPMEA